jgi:urease gamma subunit
MPNVNAAKPSQIIKGLQKVTVSSSFKIEPAEVIYIHEVIRNYPHLLKNIDDAVEAILEDGKIDIFDVPQIIKIVCIVSNNILESFKVKGIFDDASKLIEILIEAIFQSQGNVEVDGNLKKIIQNSVNLLKTNILESKQTRKLLLSCCRSI